MVRRFAGLAALAAATAACHSNSSYLKDAEELPRGPGVPDCYWFERTENSFAWATCRTPGPVVGAWRDTTAEPRAPRAPNPACTPDPAITRTERRASSVPAVTRAPERAAPAPLKLTPPPRE